MQRRERRGGRGTKPRHAADAGQSGQRGLGLRVQCRVDPGQARQRCFVGVAVGGEGGPAADGGVQIGDIVTTFDGQSIADSTELIVAIRANAPGDQVTLTVQRNGQTQDVTVALGSK